MTTSTQNHLLKRTLAALLGIGTVLPPPQARAEGHTGSLVAERSAERSVTAADWR